MTNYAKRIKKEITELLYDTHRYLYINNKPIASIDDIDDINTRILYCNIRGPDKSPYENGIFKICIKIPEAYPYDPIIIKFITPIYHPNLYSTDYIVLISDDNWSPSYHIKTVILHIYIEMMEPTKELLCDSLNNENKQLLHIINQFKKDYVEWENTAKLWTKLHATNKLWSILQHKQNYNKNKNILYLLWLGKQLENKYNIIIDVWIMNVMPYIIGKVGLNIITRKRL